MTTKKLYQELYEAHRWLETVNESFKARAEERYQAALDLLPSGSGFDAGTALVDITDTKMVLSSSYHKMDENGGYRGWDDFKVVVKSCFSSINVKIISTSGRIEPEDREYYAESFYSALNQEVG